MKPRWKQDKFRLMVVGVLGSLTAWLTGEVEAAHALGGAVTLITAWILGEAHADNGGARNGGSHADATEK